MTALVDLRPGRVLAIGSHSDDIEIGCAGTLLRLRRLNPDLIIDWVVLAATGERRQEAEAGFSELAGAGGTFRAEHFRERYFPHLPDLKEYFDTLGRTLEPDLILCPWIGDAHQDHRTAGELTRNTFRDHLILEYEIPKSDGDLGRPSIFVTLDEEVVNQKVELLKRVFVSQHHRVWFDESVFRGLMRLRGMEAQSASGYAEAFHCRRLRLW